MGHNPQEPAEATSTNGSNSNSGTETAVDTPTGTGEAVDDHPHGDAMKSSKDDKRDHAPEVWQEGDVVRRLPLRHLPELRLVSVDRAGRQPRRARETPAFAIQ